MVVDTFSTLFSLIASLKDKFVDKIDGNLKKYNHEQNKITMANDFEALKKKLKVNFLKSNA